ncbi:hypothetical protein R1flu_000613 [Riccia fluitans]|uniref:Leucine-rich repeat and coiled-coil domain-containing protein 1 n=1 Tax=Riccia fluitans TaxID=41844 RepID=A0ABD1Y0Y6_9MARC
MEPSELREEQETKAPIKFSAATTDTSDREIKEIYAFGAGLKSLRELGLSVFCSLEFLSLHDNEIDRIEGLETLVSLRELNLSANRLKEMGGLSTLSQLQVLNLSCNQIEEIRDLQGLWALEKLVLSHNHIRSLLGLSALNGPRYSLRILDLQDNRIECILELRVLTGCRRLKELSFSRDNYTNPVCHSLAYISSVIASVPHLYKLDGKLLSVHLPHPSCKLPLTPQPSGDMSQSYLDASVPSLMYASIGKSEAPHEDDNTRNLPPHGNSDEFQTRKVLVTSQPGASPINIQVEVEYKGQGDVGNKASPAISACIGSEETPLLLQSQPEETNSRQHACVQTVNWTKEIQASQHRVLGQSKGDSWCNSEDSELEVVTIDDGANFVLPSERNNLSVTKALNGFHRRRWPNTNPNPPATRLKAANIYKEFFNSGPLEDLEKRILNLVHELAVKRTGVKRGSRAALLNLSQRTDEVEVPKVASKGVCLSGGACCRRTDEGSCFNSQEAEQSSSCDTSDNQEQNVDKKRRRHVRWSDEKSGDFSSGDSMRRWVILVQKCISRMVKHLHQAVVSLNAVPKVQESRMPSVEPVDVVNKVKENEIREGDSKDLLKCKTLEDQLAELQCRFDDESKNLQKELAAERQAVVELQKILEEKEEKFHKLFEQAKASFPCQMDAPAKRPEDQILETIISAKARVLEMEELVQNASTTAQNATVDKENSKKLVISMYKALGEERANLKLCKSELGRLHKQELESMRALGVELGKSQGIAMIEEQSAQLRQELSDKQRELNEARKENLKAREDMASLQNARQIEAAELKEVIHSLLLKVSCIVVGYGITKLTDETKIFQDQSKDAIILELSGVVRSQKAQLQGINFDESKLMTLEKELQRKQEEISSLKLKANWCEELALKVETLQQKLIKVNEDAKDRAENEKNLQSKLMTLQQENIDLASSIKRLEVSEDTVKIKNKMLDSQNETIKGLKEELSESKEASNRVLRNLETLEADWVKRLHNETEKSEDLRRQLKSRDLAVDELEEKLKVERAAKLAAERTSKLLQRKVEEKEEMLRYVEDEISEVKNLYDSKLRTFAAERDEALEELEKTRKEMDETKKALLQEAKAGRDLAVEAEKNRDLREAKTLLQKQIQVLETTISEKDFKLKEAGRRVLELESQLDFQTLAMEKQKAVASSKVRALVSLFEL